MAFEAVEDLSNVSKTQVLLFKGSSKSIPVDFESRTFQSYCFEFCGLTGLSYKTLRFRNLNRDIRPDTAISASCVFQVSHRIEFSIESRNSLQTAMAGAFKSGYLSDVTVRVTSMEEPSETVRKESLRADCQLEDCTAEPPADVPVAEEPENNQSEDALRHLSVSVLDDRKSRAATAVNEEFRLHKAILATRSPIFKRVLEFELAEAVGKEFGCQSLRAGLPRVSDGPPACYSVEVKGPAEIVCRFRNSSDCRLMPQIFEFLYTGHVRFGANVMRGLNLMVLADRFAVEDMKQRCEDDLLSKLDDDNFFEVLLAFHDAELRAEALDFRLKSLFFRNFQRLRQSTPDIEEVIAQRKGLMSSLFEHVGGRRKLARRVTFVEGDE